MNSCNKLGKSAIIVGMAFFKKQPSQYLDYKSKHICNS